MSEKMIEFVLKNIGIIVMWAGSTIISWKILNQLSWWTVVAVVVIMFFVAAITGQILSPKPVKKQAKKK